MATWVKKEINDTEIGYLAIARRDAPQDTNSARETHAAVYKRRQLANNKFLGQDTIQFNQVSSQCRCEIYLLSH